MKTLHLKMLATAMTLGMILPLKAYVPGQWTVIRTDGVLNDGHFSVINRFTGKTFVDFAIDKKGSLWIATTEQLYEVAKKPNFDYFTADPCVWTFSESNIRPTVEVDKKGKISVLLSKVLYESEDGKSWEKLIPLRDIKKAVETDHLENDELPVTEMFSQCYSPYGWAISAKFEYDKKVSYFIYFVSADDHLADRFTFTPEVRKLADEDRPFPLTDINFDKDGTIWAFGGNKSRHLWRCGSGKIEPIKEEVYDLTINPDGVAVIATPTGIKTIDKDNNMKVLTPNKATYIAFDNAGILWYQPLQAQIVATRAETEKIANAEAKSTDIRTLMKIGKQGFTAPIASAKEVEAERKAKETARLAAEGVDNARLVRLDLVTGNKFLFTEENCPVRGTISKILTDKDNFKYILAGDDANHLGIYVIKEPEAKVGAWMVTCPLLNTDDEINRNFWKLSATEFDGKFVATNGIKTQKLTLIDGQNWKEESFEAPKLPALDGETCLGYMNGIPYIGTALNDVYAIENGKMLRIEGFSRKNFGAGGITAFAATKDNHMWIGGYKGLALYDGSKSTYYDKKGDPGLPSVNVLSLKVIGDNVFIGTTDGLSVFDGSKWTFYDKATGLNKRVNAIASNSKGETFIASVNAFLVTEKITLYSNGELKHESLPRKINVDDMMCDKNDNLWILDGCNIVCRKANGEYVVYEAVKDIPISDVEVIENMSIVDGELRLSVNSAYKGGRPTTSSAFQEEMIRRVGTFSHKVLKRKL